MTSLRRKVGNLVREMISKKTMPRMVRLLFIISEEDHYTNNCPLKMRINVIE
jgi:hypothetical protein